MAIQKPKQREYVQEIVIDAPTSAVWKAISEAAELSNWFSPTAEIDDHVGGKVRWTWTDQISWPQTIQQRDEGFQVTPPSVE